MALCAIVLGLLLPLKHSVVLAGDEQKAVHITCVNNLKQIGLAFKMWRNDHDAYPFNVSTNAGGTLELCAVGNDGFDSNVALHFKALSNELTTPIILICPKDSSKKAAVDFQSLGATNISYRLHSGTNFSDANPRAVLLVCPIDGNVLYCDGTVSRLKPKSRVVIQTGPERMSNAFRCMSYAYGLAVNQLKERAGIRCHVAALAGAMYFHDCLMAKMSNGYITVTTNELRNSFSNAVAQLFTNQIPVELAKILNSTTIENNDYQHSPQAMYEHDKRGFDHPEVALADGVTSSFNDRNNMHISVDEQYSRMAQSPEVAPVLNTLDKAFQQAGITDADQSDLKETCLQVGAMRTSAYLIYGPKSDTADLAEYQALADTLDKILQWRLVNMYGLDDATAQSLVKAVSRVPVTGVSHAGLQVPAYIQ